MHAGNVSDSDSTNNFVREHGDNISFFRFHVKYDKRLSSKFLHELIELVFSVILSLVYCTEI